MPDFANFSSLPPFPKDIPIAPLHRISLSSLLTPSRPSQTSPDSTSTPTPNAESKRLFSACRTSGFFFLDLRDHALGRALLSTVDPGFGFAEDLFSTLSLDEKTAFDPAKLQRSNFGYNGVGGMKIDDKGTPDRNEFWVLSRDDILASTPSVPNPHFVRERGYPIMRSFATQCHEVVKVILQQLDINLKLNPGTLASLQPLDQPSGSSIRVIKTPPQPAEDRRVSFTPHTDFGAVTVLFNALGGLQILPPGAEPSDDSAWRFVKPEEGCAIINMGDSMVEWSAGILRSSMHRVKYAPGEQAGRVRYSIAYFSRPQSETVMGPLMESEVVRGVVEKAKREGKGEIGLGGVDGRERVTAKEWEKYKIKALKEGRNVSKSMGGVELVDASA